MNWDLEFKKIFLKELSKLPTELRTRIEKIVFIEKLVNNPFEILSLEKMSEYSDKYRIRIGDYRIVLTVDNSNKKIIFCRVAHRKDIYKLFP